VVLAQELAHNGVVENKQAPQTPMQGVPVPTVEASTRTRVARLIGQEGPITVALLAQRLGLTPAAVRRHLDVMLAHGLVEVRTLGSTTARRTRGRPARAFVLTDTGHVSLATSYDVLALQALQFLADEHGRGAVESFAARRFADLERRLAPRVDAAGEDTAARAVALAEALQGDGFATSTRPIAQGTAQQAVQLCQGHCPVRHVAEEFPELCEAETALFSRLLGVHVRRLATLAQGDHVCTTHIPTGTIPVNPRRTLSGRTA